MNIRNFALVAAVSAFASGAGLASPVKPQPNKDKCFGISKAGHNDCAAGAGTTRAGTEAPESGTEAPESGTEAPTETGAETS